MLSICTGLLFILDVTVSPEFLLPVEVSMVPEAHADFGTRRRTAVVAYSAGKSSGASEGTAATTAAPAPAPAAPAATGEPLPLGTVVTSLPAGCTAAPVGGVEYYNCGANSYRAVFQGNSLVYVTAKP